ncbi:MAG: DNA polymerase III subunit delta', partial [Candidatus Berkelbacteria bacterium Gr01-1014_85]
VFESWLAELQALPSFRPADFWRYEGEKLGLIDLKPIKEMARLKTPDQGWQLLIIPGAWRLTDEAANALLKLIEDRQERISWLFQIESVDSLLPTLASRLQIFSLLPESTRSETGEWQRPSNLALEAITGQPTLALAMAMVPNWLKQGETTELVRDWQEKARQQGNWPALWRLTTAYQELAGAPNQRLWLVNLLLSLYDRR